MNFFINYIYIQCFNFRWRKYNYQEIQKISGRALSQRTIVGEKGKLVYGFFHCSSYKDDRI